MTTTHRAAAEVRRPTIEQVETALDVLLWLQKSIEAGEREDWLDDGGSTTDHIGDLRSMLWDELVAEYKHSERMPPKELLTDWSASYYLTSERP